MNVGIDVEMVDRFEKLLNEGSGFSKIFTVNEMKYFDNFKEKAMHMAGHFCAKEAFAKAIKTGFGKDIFATDVEISHEKTGAPYIVKNEKVLKVLDGRDVEISISHTRQVASSICVLS